jgi:hypothetical protein
MSTKKRTAYFYRYASGIFHYRPSLLSALNHSSIALPHASPPFLYPSKSINTHPMQSDVLTHHAISPLYRSAPLHLSVALNNTPPCPNKTKPVTSIYDCYTALRFLFVSITHCTKRDVSLSARTTQIPYSSLPEQAMPFRLSSLLFDSIAALNATPPFQHLSSVLGAISILIA